MFTNYVHMYVKYLYFFYTLEYPIVVLADFGEQIV